MMAKGKSKNAESKEQQEQGTKLSTTKYCQNFFDSGLTGGGRSELVNLISTMYLHFSSDKSTGRLGIGKGDFVPHIFLPCLTFSLRTSVYALLTNPAEKMTCVLISLLQRSH
jgi:hypothetical protein